MKKLLVLIVIFILFGTFIVLKNKANNIKSYFGSVGKGTYMAQVIISAPWGEKQGEFGIYEPTEGGPAMGPRTFTIAPNGDIYVNDVFNGRIQRFSNNGQLISIIPLSKGEDEICVDQSGNIYLYDSGLVPKRIYQYDDKGDLLKEYTIIWDDLGMRIVGGVNMYCDKSGSLFLSYRSDSLKTQMVFQVGTTEMVFSSEQQKNTLQIVGKYLGLNVILPDDWENYLNKISAKIFSINSKRNAQKSITKELNINKERVLGIDDEVIYNIAKDEKSPDVSIILKYNYDGDLLATYTLNWKESKCETFQTEDAGLLVSKQAVFDKGNLYTYIQCKDGLKIIKWSSAEGE